ncbi:MAG: ROK family protein [Planctomycetaceae bacterium]|nr:ROK family protein [Planctomycetaceae bacterium]
MFLGIEIGGTKLQLAVGRGDGSPFEELIRLDVVARRGALGIRHDIVDVTRSLTRRHNIERLGIGFGGPVQGDSGVVLTSHQIEGWTGFPLVEWCRQELDLNATLGNDCDVAALAEARFGAGRGRRIVLYVTVGTGIGGGLCVDGRIHGTFRPAATEIGHLRPGLAALDAHDTVESIASGRGIEAAAKSWIASCLETGSAQTTWYEGEAAEARRLLERAGGSIEAVTTRHVADAAGEGCAPAHHILNQAAQTLGWAIAQASTLIAPEVVIVGGGVSLMDAALFFEPLKAAARQYVFPALADSFTIVPAALGEDVVVHGALALAAAAQPRAQEEV